MEASHERRIALQQRQRVAGADVVSGRLTGKRKPASRNSRSSSRRNGFRLGREMIEFSVGSWSPVMCIAPYLIVPVTVEGRRKPVRARGGLPSVLLTQFSARLDDVEIERRRFEAGAAALLPDHAAVDFLPPRLVLQHRWLPSSTARG